MSKLEKGASYPGLEIIAKLATVLEVEPAELLRVRATGRGLLISYAAHTEDRNGLPEITDATPRG